MSSASAPRNWAPHAPSSAPWSQDRVSTIVGLDGGLTVDGDDAVGDAADGEDAGLRQIDDGVEGVDAVPG